MQAGLKVKPSKCFLFREEIAYLGHVVSAQGISTDPRKTEAIQNYPVPQNIQEVRRFVGFASYCRRFIPNFAELAAPLHQLTQKSTKFLWTQECQNAFQELKEKFTEAPILGFPHFDAPFILYTDASDYGIGSVLSQKIDGTERVIAYASRQLSKAERRGPTTEKEALAVVWSVKYFRPYLLGHRFTLVTDHQPLKWLKSMKDPPPKIARWIMSLQEYDFEVHYRPGKLHTNADTMSRISVIQEVLPVISSTVLKRTELGVEVQKTNANIQHIIQWKEANKGIPPDLDKSTLDSEMRSLLNQWNRLQVENGTLLRQWRPAAHLQPQLQIVLTRKKGQEILEELHSKPTGGHLGVRKKAAKVQQRYYWPRWMDDVKHYVENCCSCNQRKPPAKLPRAPLQSMPIGEAFEMIAMDICGPFPVTEGGNKYILVAADYLTKWPEVWAIPDQEAKTIAQKLEELISRHGAPQILLTDQGKNFESKLIAELCDLLQIDKRHTTAYHPQCDGQVERFNRTLTTMLSMYVEKNQKDWDRWLPQVLLAYRSSVHESTGATSFALLYGRKARLPVDLCFPCPTDLETSITPIIYQEYTATLQSKLNDLFLQAREKLQLSQKRQADKYNSKAWGKPFDVGDRVWLFNPRTPRGLSPKLTKHWTGPFTIEKQTSEVDYLVKEEKGRKTLVVHHNRLKLCTSPMNTPTEVTCCPTDVNDQKESRELQEQNAEEDLIAIIPANSANSGESTPQPRRSQRNRQPPDRFGNNVYDYGDLVP